MGSQWRDRTGFAPAFLPLEPSLTVADHVARRTHSKGPPNCGDDTACGNVGMLAAMPQLSSTSQARVNPPVRDRGDACPGALRLHSADDGALARIRIPAGLLTARQAVALADAADRLGDGRIDITSRGNLQLRGLDECCAGQLASVLETSGLLPSPRHERVRNIVASPLSGLDGAGAGDVRGWAARLDALLCASEEATGLSGRFLFALDDGRGDVASLDADVTLLAQGGDALLRVGGERAAVRVPGDAAPGAALTAAEMFLTAIRDTGAHVWRVRELPAGQTGFARRLSDILRENGTSATYVADAPAPRGAPPAPGAVPGAGTDSGGASRTESGGASGAPCALSVVAPLGRLTAAQWRQLAGVAAQDGTGELRVTPWRGVVLPLPVRSTAGRSADVRSAAGPAEGGPSTAGPSASGQSDSGLSGGSAGERLRGLGAAGLITGPSSPWLGVGACTGRPGCAKSHRDVRADAAAAVAESAATESAAVTEAAVVEAAGTEIPVTEGTVMEGALPVYWSGCERRCGHPRGDWVDVVADEEGYTVRVRGEDPAGAEDPAGGDDPAGPESVQGPGPESVQGPGPESVHGRGLAGAVASARARWTRTAAGAGTARAGTAHTTTVTR